MKNRFLNYLIYFCIVMSLTQVVWAQDKIPVVTTIGQITDVVKMIGGDRVHVQGLMSAGVDPHLYKVSESDVRKLTNAKIIFYNGLYLEAKMESIFEIMKRNKVTVAVGEVNNPETLLESVDYAGHYDPHIWFDVRMWMKVTEKIRDTFIEFDPEYQSDYERRADQYLSRLHKLHAHVEQKVNELTKEQRVLVTAHDAFRYFGRTYDFEVLGLQGMSTESVAGTRDVMALADLIVERKIKAIFIESSVPERNIKAVQEAVRSRGWNVEVGGELFSDAMGDEGTFEGTYIGMVMHNVGTIVEALK